jgi:hypothetical protein
MNTIGFKKTQNILPDEAEGTSKFIECGNTDADRFLKKRLPLIRCECGAEILLVPDLRAMNRAVKTHVTEHRKGKSTQKNLGSSIKISRLLSQLTLTRASEESDN